MGRVVFVTSGLEHLGIAALSAYARVHGHEARLVYEPKPFSSDSGPDNRLLARWLEPTPAETAERVIAEQPDVVAFSSYTITHAWSVSVARQIKRRHEVPIVFGGPHVSGAPEQSIREGAIDAIVEGEGEGALVDLLECAGKGRFARDDIPNVWFSNGGAPIRNSVRPLIGDLDSLPWADKSGFYSQVPAFEREFYVVSRRGCPFRCSFCEYSIFPRQYPGEKPVRRRSVPHLIRELEAWKRRGRVRKIFFWDAIFTLDVKWMEEFADAYAERIGLPFECYTHPQAMTRQMAQELARAGCTMVRVGVQSVNSGTLAAMERKGDAERVTRTIDHLRQFGIPYALDHIAGLPGEGPEDQKDAVRFYNAVRPAQIYMHWMTYLPGTTALERARESGLLSGEQVERILRGEETHGYEAPRLVGAGPGKLALDEIKHIVMLFRLMPLLPQGAIDWLLESGAYRWLPDTSAVGRAVELVVALRGNSALRERVYAILIGAGHNAVETLAGRIWRSGTRRHASRTNDQWPEDQRDVPVPKRARRLAVLAPGSLSDRG